MVGSPNARTRVDNQQRAELDGSEGTDTHFALISGSSGSDTRAAHLGGEVVDTHAGQLDGSAQLNLAGNHVESSEPPNRDTANTQIPLNAQPISLAPDLWSNIRSYNVNSPGTGNHIFIMFATSIFPPNPTFNEQCESRVVRNGTEIFPTASFTLNTPGPQTRYNTGLGLFFLVDENPPEGSNTYTLQMRCVTEIIGVNEFASALYSVPITITNDTHVADLVGDSGTDTHNVILRGPSVNSLEPILLGEPGVDTHDVNLIGNPPAAQPGSIQSISIVPPFSVVSQPGYATTTSLTPAATITAEATEHTSGIIVAFHVFFMIRFNRTVQWILQRSDGVILSSGSRTRQTGSTRYMENASDVVIDTNPSVGTNTYQFFCFGGPDNFHKCTLATHSYAITDDHSARLVGSNIDNHNPQISGAIIPDTHTVSLQGSPPVDTHIANLIGNVRGKSPIGGRLR